MTPSARLAQLERWGDLIRLVIGRASRDTLRIEQLEREILAAIETEKREAEALAVVDAHVAREMGGGA